MEKIRILVTDDHEIFRRGLAMILSRSELVLDVYQASSGFEAEQVYREKAPDIVLMDVQMPEKNGIESTKAIVSFDSEAKIIAISMFGEEKFLHDMVSAGAKGFVLKKSNIDELELALQSVLKGYNYFWPELLQYCTKSYLKNNDRGEPILSNREIEVLKLVSEGFTNQEIADKLFISKRTVDGHKNSMIEKTGSKNIVELLKYAFVNKLIDW